MTDPKDPCRVMAEQIFDRLEIIADQIFDELKTITVEDKTIETLEQIILHHTALPDLVNALTTYVEAEKRTMIRQQDDFPSDKQIAGAAALAKAKELK